MSLSSSIQQTHHVLGGSGFRYETVELVLASIPHFELKQKGRILHLFAEIYNTFMQEIQEALDERQNNIDSLTDYQRTDQSVTEPFAFESQLDTDTQPVDLSTKSFDESFQTTSKFESTLSNETYPVLAAIMKNNDYQNSKYCQDNYNGKANKDCLNIKKEVITPPKIKRHQSKTSTITKQKLGITNSSTHQMTMTQLFDPIEPSRSSVNKTRVKNEPRTPNDDTILNMPESLVGLAERSTSPFNYHDQNTNLSDLTLPIRATTNVNSQSFKRKSSPSETVSDELAEQTCEEDDNVESFQNEALLQTPYSGIDSEELLYACPMCRNYWLGLPPELRHEKGLTCRHRQRPVARTPEHFWSLGIPNTQTCIERGYGGVLPPNKPIERPRRPRRQHQRILREKQQPMNNDNDDNSD